MCRNLAIILLFFISLMEVILSSFLIRVEFFYYWGDMGQKKEGLLFKFILGYFVIQCLSIDA